MLSGFQLVRNIGCFDSFQGSPDTAFAPLTLVYAENGRGKTTIAAILRSLAAGTPGAIKGRSRLGSQHAPHVVVNIDGQPQPSVFQNDRWSGTYSDIAIFDDHFVDDNVYSGLAVGPSHRQNLHEIILGRQGVVLARRVDELTDEIADLNRQLREKEATIPNAKMFGLDVETFCGLDEQEQIDDDIAETERTLDAVEKADQVRTTGHFSQLEFPTIDVSGINTLLGKQIADLDEAAVTRVSTQATLLGEDGEQWIADGVSRIQGATSTDKESCPFCGQSITGIDLVDKYRAYFGEAYRSLQTEIASAIAACRSRFSGDALAQCQRSLNALTEQYRFWSDLTTLPPLEIDLDALAARWGQARDTLLSSLRSKQQAPLDPLQLDDQDLGAFTEYIDTANALSLQIEALVGCNPAISEVKESVDTGDLAQVTGQLNRLKAAKERHSDEIKDHCDDYLALKQAKLASENAKREARDALDSHRRQVFPSYRDAVNHYLSRFGASFRIDGVEPRDTAGRPSTTYQLAIRNTTVPLSGGNASNDGPSFKNALSAGDRNTLALAFFFASLDSESDLSNMVIVVDDPVSSLDDGRAIATVQEVRRLSQQAKQVIILSHAKPFLCRIFKHARPEAVACLNLARSGQDSSALEPWEVTEDEFTEYDRRHRMLREFRTGTAPNIRQVAEGIRPVMEGYLRIAYPEHCPPGTLLGAFRQRVQFQIDVGNSVMTTDRLLELEEITDYANKFHHDTNPAWETEHISDNELLGFVNRALSFISN